MPYLDPQPVIILTLILILIPSWPVRSSAVAYLRVLSPRRPARFRIEGPFRIQEISLVGHYPVKARNLHRARTSSTRTGT